MSSKLPHDREFLLDWETLVDRGHTKTALARHHFPPEKFTWDCALPQAWLDHVTEQSEDLDYAGLLFTIVWLYPGKGESPSYWLSGIPAVLCEDTARQLERLNIAYWSPRGYHGQRHIKQPPFVRSFDNE